MSEPTPPTIEQIVRENLSLGPLVTYINRLNRESELGVVLISATMIEGCLRQLLLAHLLDVPEAAQLVDGANAPLGTFAARTAACYVQGLISETEYRECVLIRRIRNEFAHDIDISFDTPSISDRCRELRELSRFNYSSEARNSRAEFTVAAMFTVARLSFRDRHISERRLTWITPPP